MNMGASTKRRFLGLAFFPYGGDIASSIGMVGQSPDVEKHESLVTQSEYARMMSASPKLEAVVKLAEWYSAAAQQAGEDALPAVTRTPEEHLISFYMAADRLIADAERASR